jgi:hypothetical protein
MGLLGLDKLPGELSGINQPRIGEVETEGYYEIGVEPSMAIRK